MNSTTMNVTMSSIKSNICNHHKYGFCKFSDRCRKKHIDEICLENNCEIKMCLKRHPRPCKFFDLYQKCKFGTFCAFKHCESIQAKELKNLKSKVEDLEVDNLEKSKEISFLIERLELVEQIIAEREEIFIEATKVVAGNKTPVGKGTKKRKKAKQHPTPSPVHVAHRASFQHKSDDADHADADKNSDDEVSVGLTAEEIAELYEDKDPPEM